MQTRERALNLNRRRTGLWIAIEKKDGSVGRSEDSSQRRADRPLSIRLPIERDASVSPG